MASDDTTPLIGIAKLAASGRTLEKKERVEYRELPTRRLLNRCDSERVGFAWTINPYRGCEYGCRYCYARYTHEYMERRERYAFETEIYAKQWSAAGFREELARVGARESIAIGTATDPYQPAERRFRLTRRVLEVLAEGAGRRIYLTTKSDLVSRDAELLRKIAERNGLGVTVTITTMDRKLARLLEPMAPRPDLRLKTVEMLARAGVQTGVMASPILPLLTDSIANLEEVAAGAKAAGARSFFAGVLFLQPSARKVFFPFLQQEFPELLERYAARYAKRAFVDGRYPALMKERVDELREKYELTERVQMPAEVEGKQLTLF